MASSSVKIALLRFISSYGRPSSCLHRQFRAFSSRPLPQRLPPQFSLAHWRHAGLRSLCDIQYRVARCSFSTDASPNATTDASSKGTTESHVNSDQGSAKEDAENKEAEEPLDEKTQVLEAALSHVPKLGWSEAAMVAGARDVGLSPAILGAFPRKEAALLEYFMDECLQKLLDEIENHEEEIAKTVLQERIAKLVRLRLEMQAPYISRWAQALSIQASPANIPTTFKQRAVLMDEIWHAAGDRSSDVDWYTKRGLLAGVYTATELYMLTDYSPGFRETWSFLERRIKEVVDCRKTAQEATQIAQAIRVGLGNTIQSFFRR